MLLSHQKEEKSNDSSRGNRTDDQLIEELKALKEFFFRQIVSFQMIRRRVILADSSANIIAGPGSGKTTVLIAKIAFG